jgi:hypothetical protein
VSREIILGCGKCLELPERWRKKMYYRVAIQVDSVPTWQWKSTVLSSLDTLFRFLRLYGALPQECLLVFSSSSREGLEEQFVRENAGVSSTSVTTAQFLQERLIYSPEATRETREREGGPYQQMASIAVATQPSVNESSRGINGLVGKGMGTLERKRLELEFGPGGDHDVPYSFVLPPLMPQVLAWTRLLARIQRRELQL